MNKKVFSFLLFFLVVVSFSFTKLMEKGTQTFNDRSTVSIPKESEKILFFYRDDCSECKQVLPKMYMQQTLKGNVLFINTNNVENKKNAKKRKIKTVPTLIKGEKFYSGTETKEINKILEE